MKAVLLLTVGSILIWLGLSGGGDKGEVVEAGEKSELTPREESVPDPRSEVRLTAADGGSEAPDPIPEAPAPQAHGGEPAPAEAPEEDMPVTLPAPEPAKEPVAAPRTRAESARVFELMKPSGDPMALAETLLEAWIARDPMPIQDHLNSEAGGELPADQRALVGAFWQALVGRGDQASGEYTRLEDSEAVSSAQLEMLGAAVGLASGGGVPENGGRRDALARSMRMVLLEESARLAALEGRHPDAAQDLSDLIHAELAAPWPPHRAELYTWAEALRASQLLHRLDKRGDWPHVSYTVTKDDIGLGPIRRKVLAENPSLRTCTGLIERVNGLGKYIHAGQDLKVPTDIPNMLVDLDARIAIYRHGSEAVLAWRIGIGREGHATPIGTFEVGLKQENPPWHRPGHAPLAFGHPDNLLGTRWMGWYQDGDRTSYGFHGTNDPDGVGGKVSAGCIRMHNEDVEELFELLPLHSRVVVQP